MGSLYNILYVAASIVFTNRRGYRWRSLVLLTAFLDYLAGSLRTICGGLWGVTFHSGVLDEDEVAKYCDDQTKERGAQAVQIAEAIREKYGVTLLRLNID